MIELDYNENLFERLSEKALFYYAENDNGEISCSVSDGESKRDISPFGEFLSLWCYLPEFFNGVEKSNGVLAVVKLADAGGFVYFVLKKSDALKTLEGEYDKRVEFLNGI